MIKREEKEAEYEKIRFISERGNLMFPVMLVIFNTEGGKQTFFISVGCQCRVSVKRE